MAKIGNSSEDSVGGGKGKGWVGRLPTDDKPR